MGDIGITPLNGDFTRPINHWLHWQCPPLQPNVGHGTLPWSKGNPEETWDIHIIHPMGHDWSSIRMYLIYIYIYLYIYIYISIYLISLFDWSVMHFFLVDLHFLVARTAWARHLWTVPLFGSERSQHQSASDHSDSWSRFIDDGFLKWGVPQGKSLDHFSNIETNGFRLPPF